MILGKKRRAAIFLVLPFLMCAGKAWPAAALPGAQLRAWAARAQSSSNWPGLRRFAASQKNIEQRALAYFVLGYREYDAGSNDSAVPDLGKAAAIEFSLSDYAVFYLASAAQENNQPEIVLKSLASFSVRFPQSPLQEDARELYARTLVQSGQPQRAADVLTASPRVRQEPALALLLADAYRAARKDEDAARTYQEIYYAFPASVEARTASQALEQLRPQLGDKFPAVSEEIQTARCQKLFDRARYPDALQGYEALLRDRPKSPLAARWIVGRARCLYRMRRIPEALDQLQQPFANNPGMEANRLSVLAGIYARQSDPQSMDLMIDQLAKLYASSRSYASALDTAGDYFVRQGDWQRAARYYQPLAAHFPDSVWGLEASWRVAWSYYLQKNFDAARDAFEDHLKRYPGSWHYAGGLYWLARMAEEHGAGGAARKLYQSLVKQFRQSYYAAQAERRLKELAERRTGFDSMDTGDWPLVAQAAGQLSAPDSPFAPCKSADPSPEMSRVEAFQALRLAELAEQYLRSLIAERPGNKGVILALSRLEMEQGELAPSVMDAMRAVNNYPDFGFNGLPKAVWELLYPRAYWTLVRQAAASQGINPYLIMGLIRQESTFNPKAVSVADARGLMQILPETVTRYRSRRRAAARRLMSPAYNVRIGTRLLKQLTTANGGEMELALAAYHAGQSRVNAWRAQVPFRDSEEFLESIPIPSTRGYVERVIRDAAIYRKLLTGAAEFADCRVSGGGTADARPSPE